MILRLLLLLIFPKNNFNKKKGKGFVIEFTYIIFGLKNMAYIFFNLYNNFTVFIATVCSTFSVLIGRKFTFWLKKKKIYCSHFKEKQITKKVLIKTKNKNVRRCMEFHVLCAHMTQLYELLLSPISKMNKITKS